MCRAISRFVAVVLALLVPVPAAPQSETRPERSPILVTFDLHMDPMPGQGERRRQTYEDWRDAAEWLLDVAEKRGAKLSFTTVGEFAELALEDPERAFPLIRRLYESGGSVGTHSHNRIQDAPFRWSEIPRGGSAEDAEQVWHDDISMVDRLVAAVFDLDDPKHVRAINNLRGTHVPSDAALRQGLFKKYGLSFCQAGPGEDFVGLFHHYLFHPFRASAKNEIAEDRSSPMIVTQAGPVLGQVGVHKGVEQDMSLPRVQAEFLVELLAWLHDAEAGLPDRVWCFGWAVHGSDVTERGVSREWVEPALDWFSRHFVGKSIGGRTVARWSSYQEECESYLAWEKANPDLESRDYDGRARAWDAYPWPTVAAAAYLWDATYAKALRSDETAQAHLLEAADPLGGPYPIVVAFPTGRGAARLDLAAVEAGKWTRIDAASGPGVAGDAAALEIPTNGAIFIPTRACVSLEQQQERIDEAFARELPRFGPGAGGPGVGKGKGQQRGGGTARLDRNGDGKVTREEFPGKDAEFRRLDQDGNDELDDAELEKGRPR